MASSAVLDPSTLSPVTLGAIVVTAVLIVAQLAYAWYGSQYRRTMSMMARLPQPRGVPILGHALELGLLDDTGRLALLRTWIPKFPHLLAVWLGPLASVVVYSPPGIGEVLKSSKHSGKGISYQFLHEWLGTGLLTAAGLKWKSRRRMITPSFHFEILRGFVETFSEQADVLVTNLRKEADTGKYFDLFPYITHAALDIICDSAMGKTVNAQGTTENAYVEAVYEVSRSLFNRTLQPWNWNKFLYTNFTSAGRTYVRKLKILHDFTRKVIRDRRAARAAAGSAKKAQAPAAEGESQKKPFLDMLLDATDDDGQPLTDADIQEEVDTFMFEGHDTTSAGVAWTFYQVSKNPEIQRKMQEEIDSVLGDRRLPTFEDLHKLHYVEMVIKEALRMFPSVPIIARILDEDIVIEGHVVPRGMQVAVLIVAVHYDPLIWGDDADTFRPERFSDEESEGRNMYAYVPFSAGPRNCIGQKFAILEEKMLVTAILRNFNVTQRPGFEVQPHAELILRPSEVPVALTTRKL